MTKRGGKPKRDAERESRIECEIVADAYDSDERAMGWFNYLQDQLQFPFTATCVEKRAISPLAVKDEVEVIDIADPDECGSEIFVMIRWSRKDGLGVPLSQLRAEADVDEATREAVEDWGYWARMGYEF